jgi:hypothetical protein
LGIGFFLCALCGLCEKQVTPSCIPAPLAVGLSTEVGMAPVNTERQPSIYQENLTFRLFLKTQTAIIQTTLVHFPGKDNEPPLNVITREKKEKMIGFGDNVLVLSTSETKKHGIAGIRGNVRGETTPSGTNVDVIGEVTDDYALHVQPDNEETKGFWIVPCLLEFIDHAPGTEMIVGNIRAVRREDGSWEETRISQKKPWWKFWS